MKKRITTASAKAKGRWLQNWVAERIAAIFSLPAWKGDDNAVTPRPMGQAGVDVILRGAIQELFPFSIECKSGESIGWLAAILQAKRNQKKDTHWLVFMKTKKVKEPVVMLDAGVFLNLMQSEIKRGILKEALEKND